MCAPIFTHQLTNSTNQRNIPDKESIFKSISRPNSCRPNIKQLIDSIRRSFITIVAVIVVMFVVIVVPIAVVVAIAVVVVRTVYGADVEGLSYIGHRNSVPMG